jgi:hypothetical protein
MDHLDSNIAWAAGLFEGEGSIHVSSQGNRYRWPRVQITLGSTDHDVVARFVEIVGVGRIHTQTRPNRNHRTMYRWDVRGLEAAAILKAFMPWLGARRRAKAEEALALVAQMNVPNGKKTHCPHGHPYDEENTSWFRGARRCRACNRVECRKRRQEAAV